MESILSEEREAEREAGPDPVLVSTVKSGANWFYWIAALSLINTIIVAFEGNVSFPVGLGLSQIFGAFGLYFSADGGSSVYIFISILLSAIVSAVFAGFGYYAGRGFQSAFIAGSVLYILDAFLCLIFSDFLAAGFHVFALIFIVKGALANRSIRQWEQSFTSSP